MPITHGYKNAEIQQEDHGEPGEITDILIRYTIVNISTFGADPKTRHTTPGKMEIYSGSYLKYSLQAHWLKICLAADGF